MVTRRCTQRQYLLKPCKQTNEIVGYCVGLAAAETGILLYAVCFMSNHWHAVLSDPDGKLPKFLERAHSLIAKCQNAALDRCEGLWSTDKTSVVELISEEDVLDKMAYVMANPTAAGLVHSPCEWPGVITERIGQRLTFATPDFFFEQDASDDDDAVLEFVRPAIFTHLCDEELNRRLLDRVAERVREKRAEYRREGKRFIGREAVLQQAFTDAPLKSEIRRKFNPRIAAKDPSLRSLALLALKRFIIRYREALRLWREGRRDVVFPLGTYALRVHARAPCEELTC
jgi:putative transposase